VKDDNAYVNSLSVVGPPTCKWSAMTIKTCKLHKLSDVRGVVAAANTVSVTVFSENGKLSTTDVAEQTGTGQESKWGRGDRTNVSTSGSRRNGVGGRADIAEECSSAEIARRRRRSSSGEGALNVAYISLK
jgi:hypothetical protein